MKLKCIYSGLVGGLTEGNEYEGDLEEARIGVNIVNDCGVDMVYCKSRFEIVEDGKENEDGTKGN